jgi:hypothetical protein
VRAGSILHILVSDCRIDAVTEPGVPPRLRTRDIQVRRALGVEDAGIDIDPPSRREAARGDLVGEESPSLNPALMVARPDPRLRDAQFTHAPLNIGFGDILPFTGESDGVLSRIRGDRR